MPVDHDTFFTAVYLAVDAVLAPMASSRRRRGRPPRMTDSEVVTIMLLQQWLGFSDRQLVCHVRSHLAAWFPRMLSASAYNRRSRRLRQAVLDVQLRMAEDAGAEDTPYQIVDAMPIPVVNPVRGRQGTCLGDAVSMGYGGSDRTYFYGCQLLLATAANGVITGWTLGPGKTQMRWIFDAFATWRHDPTAAPWQVEQMPPRKPSRLPQGPTGLRFGPASAGRQRPVPYLADKGFSGPDWLDHWSRDLGAELVLPPDDDEDALQDHRRRRQTIETVNSLLDSQLHIKRIRAHTYEGLCTRVAAKIAAFNVAVVQNLQFGRSPLAIGSLAWG
jgi:hypothetical protein